MQQKVSIIDRASYWVIRMGIVCMVIFAAMAVSGNNPHEIAPSINQHATVLSDKTQRDNKSEAGSITQSNIKIDQLPDSSLPVFLTMPVTSTKAENLKIANMIFNDQYKFAEFLKDVFYFTGGKIDYDV